jgi:hypothetical protein
MLTNSEQRIPVPSIDTGRDTEVKKSDILTQAKSDIQKDIISRNFARIAVTIESLEASVMDVHIPTEETYDFVLQAEKIIQQVYVTMSEFVGEDKEDPVKQQVFDRAKQAYERIQVKRQEIIMDMAGPEFAQAWNQLNEDYPEFQNIQVVINKDPNHHSPHFRANEFSRKMEVHMAVHDTEQVYTQIRQNRATITSFAELLGVTPEDITPAQLKIFVLAHEYGHAYDLITNYLQHEGSTQAQYNAQREQRTAELAILPVPNMASSKIIALIEEQGFDAFIAQFPHMEGKTQTEILEEQAISYRRLPSESFADQFAAQFMKRHATQFGLPT